MANESYVAEWNGETNLKLYLFRDADENADPQRHINGWSLVVDQRDGNGLWQPKINYFNESYEALLEFPETHAPRGIVWRDSRTGDVVDIYSLRF